MSLNREQEAYILNQCLVMDNMDGIVREYDQLIRAVVRKTFLLSGVRVGHEDIEDGTMEVYIRIFSDNYKKLRQYDSTKLTLAGWIKLIANQTTIDEIRKKDPHSVSRNNERIMINDVYQTLKLHPDRMYDAKEKLSIVIDAIEEMPPKDKMVLKMFYCDHLTLEEVAEKIGQSRKTTQTVKDRARRRLREKVESRIEL